jgi:hypothetical protein
MSLSNFLSSNQEQVQHYPQRTTIVDFFNTSDVVSGQGHALECNQQPSFLMHNQPEMHAYSIQTCRSSSDSRLQ